MPRCGAKPPPQSRAMGGLLPGAWGSAGQAKLVQGTLGGRSREGMQEGLGKTKELSVEVEEAVWLWQAGVLEECGQGGGCGAREA